MGENSPEESMDFQASSEKLVVHDENVAPPSSSSAAAAVNLQNKVKKPTRQWAAWTRQEEENFFNALRQVGKNFEKITCRVQSKNKDQVRHYYYRLVRRMNKLLGPEFCLDAKNSKDTIAAMLRWWSLLEKYSCTASKLHLKPRRFKTFIEALAHQLLKDRNKTRRKRSSHQESNLFIPPTSASIMARGLEKDVEPVKLLFLENQKMQKVGYAPKSSSLKGNNVRTSNNCGKGGLTIAKSVKQNRRTGIVASAAYRRWEKAALAGVSLVADAAEQLERTASDRKVSSDSDQTTFNALPPKESEQVHNAGITSSLTPSLSSGIHSSHHKQIPVQPYTKLKLQLFPIDENTRKALEKGNHNPFLELTLSARKRISSIIEHLNCKWGKSSVASGELMLFPYDIPTDNLTNCQRWSLRDKVACAADVYGIVGKPNIFRLRYGWVSCLENESKIVQLPSPFIDHANEVQCRRGPEGAVDNIDPDRKTLAIEPENNNLPKVDNVEPPVSGFHEIQIANISKHKNISPGFLQTINSSLPQEQPRNENGKQNDEENLSSDIAGEWADSLTNISIGDLLSEASRAADSTCNNQLGDGNAPSIQDTPFSCDSFDAAIAAHISGCKDLHSTTNQVSHVSIWDAEETCDGLSFKKNSSHNREDSGSLHKVSSESTSQFFRTDTVGFHGLLKKDAETQTRDMICHNGLETKSQCNNGVFQGNYDNANNLGLVDAYWPDSLGADLDIPPRYVGQDMIFGDSVSLGGLSRLIANSLDAFQNLSCGSEKRPPSVNLMTSISSEE